MLKKMMPRLLIFFMLLGGLGVAPSYADEPILRYGIYALPSSLDPAWGTTLSDSMLKVNVYEGLTTYDAAGNVVPGAAQRWEVSKDGLQYTFYLRKDLRWSDGSPLTAQQFANTILRVLQGKHNNQPTFHYTLLKNANEILQKKLPLSALGMKVINPHALSFTLTNPAPYFPNILAIGSFPTPGPVDNPLLSEELKPTRWVTNGAYQVSTYDLEKKQYRFVKNSFYHDSKHIYFKTVQVLRYPKPNVALFALLNGQLDSYDRGHTRNFTPSISPKKPKKHPLKTIDTNSEWLQMIPLGAVSTDYLVMNLRDQALKDRRIRQALSMALDRSAIVKTLGYSDDHRTFSFSPNYPRVNWKKLPAAWGNESLDSRRQRALSLMADAGYGLNKRLKLEFLVNQGGANALLAEAVRRQWTNIGVDLTVISHPTTLHYGEYVRKRRFQIARAGWSPILSDPSSFLENLHSQKKTNYGHWKHPAYSQQVDRLLQQPLSPEQRSTVFLTLERIIQQEVPIIPIYNKSHVALLAPWLKTINQQEGYLLLWKHFRPKEQIRN